MSSEIKELEDSIAYYKARRRDWIISSKCVDLKSIRWFNAQIFNKELLIEILKGGVCK